jgi:flagellar biosynthesis/type III secretory pathway chaperone
MCTLLERQSQVQKELLELAHEKRGVIIAGDTGRLSEIGALEMKLVARGASIERERGKLMPNVAALLGIDAGANVSSIAERAEPDEQSALRRLRRDLTETMSALRDANAANGELLDAQLEYTDIMLGVMAPRQDALNNFYGGDGRTRDGGVRRAGFLDGVL